MNNFKTPILFLIFNRPSTTRVVFEAIKKVQPAYLYVAADGTRKNKLYEDNLCEEARQIVQEIDWICEVKILFRKENLGCKLAVSSAIDWFFDNVEEGIIIEDDVLPVQSFFYYCEELLEKHRYDTNIGIITGNNLISNILSCKDSYFYSRYANIWGWATWKRIWQHYDRDLKDWPSWRDKGNLKLISDDFPYFEMYWKDQIDAIYDGKMDTWDFQFFFTCWKLDCLCVVPTNNLTGNLGFGALATHTTGDQPLCVKEATPKDLSFPLIHPLKIERNKGADILISKRVFNIGFFVTLKWKIRRVPIIGSSLAKFKKIIAFKRS